ncbi:C-terminal processing protease CtpA/Prc, contains a PDZ domain [Saccharicrinis carchari]|uniref:C-terminal processing protease CtpA/Prc, contains a PDZ domain n=1 Tax=Saccharicrinis carchari TaxID=1168039 RepID=A0A521F744_SACCC|nr:S41 family peptidase [Saccharicrinis carchari]SMO91957.1 C-terminal processing protease CtpA/Prc, contains a PDZ domain [Saccharicrinis carchari]
MSKRTVFTALTIIITCQICNNQVFGQSPNPQIKSQMVKSENLLNESFNKERYLQIYKKLYDNFYFSNEFNYTNRIAGLSKAWSEAKWNFANFDVVPNLNWDSLYYEFIPKVMEAKSEVEYYKLLMNFYSHLKDGHSMVFVPHVLRDSLTARLPIRCRLVEDQVVIIQLQSANENYCLLKPGTVITEINNHPVNEYIKKNISPYISFSTPQDSVAKIYSNYFTYGSINKPIKLKLKYSDGRMTEQIFFRKPNDPYYPHAKGFFYKKINEKTNLLTINTFYDEKLIPFIDSIFQETPHPENLIIDLRINGGGNSSNGFELLGYLTGDTFKAALTAGRCYIPSKRGLGITPNKITFMPREWKPYKFPTYTGQVIVLTGPDTYSAAEDFVLIFKHLKRGVVIGQATGGSTGQPISFSLPHGGIGCVCSQKELLIDGKDFIGKGINPDIPIDYNLKKILVGTDEVLERAIEYFTK